ncbi:hypothetical protein HY213_01355 [Candidatus Peregrinibacteria bacterium]|nr:hypothetical protein [Candidatus Peregrinibacteria bacterium]
METPRGNERGKEPVKNNPEATIESESQNIRIKIDSLKQRYKPGTVGQLLQDLYKRFLHPSRTDFVARRQVITYATMLGELWNLVQPETLSVTLPEIKTAMDYIERILWEACRMEEAREAAIQQEEYRGVRYSGEYKNAPLRYDRGTILMLATYLNLLSHR